jgi:hypothetical protein
MNDSAIALVSKPRRRVRYCCSAADFIRSTASGVLRVAKEKRVSGPSETRVMDGAASLEAISCIAARPSAHDGNR